jgi:hypothetical protein
VKKKLLALLFITAVLTGVLAILLPRQRPQYAWLAFGLDAEVRVLARLDGKALSLVRYLDGQPARLIARFGDLAECKDVLIREETGAALYRLTAVEDLNAVPPTKLLAFTVEVNQPALACRQGVILWAAFSPDEAQVAHFGGPLTVSATDKRFDPPRVRWEMPGTFALRRGDQPVELVVNVGTTNTEDSCRVVVCTCDEQERPLLPAKVCPVAEVEFPPARPGDPPPVRRYPLGRVC